MHKSIKWCSICGGKGRHRTYFPWLNKTVLKCACGHTWEIKGEI